MSVLHCVQCSNMDPKIPSHGLPDELMNTPLTVALHSISPGIPLKKLIFLLETVLPESPTILNSDKIVTSPNWTLRWSAAESEGELQVTYTVWQKREGEESWQLENVTRNIFHIGLEDNTSYSFVVKAWNKCGESMLDRDKMLNISTDFENKVTQRNFISRETVPTENMVPIGKKMGKKKSSLLPYMFLLSQFIFGQ